MSGEGNSTVVGDDYDEVWTPRSAQDLRRFMAGGVESEHMELGKKGKGVRTPKIKVGVKSKTTTKLSTNCEEMHPHIEHEVDKGFEAGFEMFKKYANHVDPTGGWGNVTIDTVKSVFPQKLKKGKEPR